MSEHPEDVVDLDAEPAPAVDADVVVVSDEADEDKLPASARRQADGSVILPLRYPVTLKTIKRGETQREDTYAELRFHRLTGADMRAIMNSEKGATFVVTAIARSTRLSQVIAGALFDRMDGADVMAIQAVVNHFLPSGR